MRAFILAGGFATRLWPITSSKPKPLLPVGSTPLLAYIIDQIPEEIPVTISINQALEESFRNFLASYDRPNVDLFVEPSFGDQQKRGALLAMSDAIRAFPADDILCIGGDNYFSFSLADFLRVAAESPEEPLLATKDIESLEAASSFGVVEVENGYIQSFEEKPTHPKSTLIGTFGYYIPKSAIPLLHEAAEKTPDQAGSLFTYFLSKGLPCRSFVFSDYWNDIGSFHDYLDVHTTINAVHASKEVHESNELQGAVYVDSSAHVINSTLVDTIILGDATIENSYLERCVVDDGVVIYNAHLVDQAIKQRVKIL